MSGCVFQLIRSREQEGLLLSGRIAIGFDDDDEQMRDFVKGVWKCVSEIGEVGVLRWTDG